MYMQVATYIFESTKIQEYTTRGTLVAALGTHMPAGCYALPFAAGARLTTAEA